MKNPLKQRFRDYQGGIITLHEFKSLFFQILGNSQQDLLTHLKLPEGILAALDDYAESFTGKIHLIGSCCCRQSDCIHTKEPDFSKAQCGVEKFLQYRA
jgi:hypothetical protein